MSEKLRAFFALPVREADQPALIEAQHRMKRQPDSSRLAARYITSQNLHITLKFLGFVPADDIPALEAIAGRLAAGVSAFELTWREVVAFGGARRARALVAAVTPDDAYARLSELAVALDTQVAELGIERETRDFIPHVTLARLKRPGNATRLLEAASLPAESVSFEELVLYRSLQTREGGVYSALARWKLV